MTVKYQIQAKQKTELETFKVKMLTDGVYIYVDGKDVAVDDFYEDYIVTREDAQLLENIEEVYNILNLSNREFDEEFNNNQEKNEWTVYEYNFGGPETYDYVMECEQQRVKAMAEIIQEVLTERNLNYHYGCRIELGNYAKIVLIRADPNIRRSCDDILKAKDYESMHKMPIMYCDCDDSTDLIHAKEVEAIFNYLYEEPLFHSALAIQQESIDVAHKNKSAKYFIMKGIDELDDHLYAYDFKNGCDFGISNEGSLAIAIFGSGYEYKGVEDYDKVLLHIAPVIDTVEMAEGIEEITKDRYDLLLRKDVNVQLHAIKDTVEREVKKMYREKQMDYEKRR